MRSLLINGCTDLSTDAYIKMELNEMQRYYEKAVEDVREEMVRIIWKKMD